MRLSLGKLTGGLILAVYGSIALLGHGLHELSSVDHHGHGASIATCAHGGHTHHGPCAVHHHEPSEQESNRLADAHDCEICVFLAHALGEPPQTTAVVVRDHVVADAIIAAIRPISAMAVGVPAPRGPPTLVA